MLTPDCQSVRPGGPGARPEPHRHLYIGLEDVQVGSKRALARNLFLAGGWAGGRGLRTSSAPPRPPPRGVGGPQRKDVRGPFPKI